MSTNVSYSVRNALFNRTQGSKVLATASWPSLGFVVPQLHAQKCVKLEKNHV